MPLFGKPCKKYLMESLNKILNKYSYSDIEKNYIKIMEELSEEIYINISGKKDVKIFDNTNIKKKDLLNFTKLPESSKDFELLYEDVLENNFKKLQIENEKKNINVKIFWSGYAEGSQRTAGLLAHYLENNLQIKARIIETTDLPKEWLNICGTWDYEGERLNKAIHKLYSNFENKLELLFKLSDEYANGRLLSQLYELKERIEQYRSGGAFFTQKNMLSLNQKIMIHIQ